MEPLNPSSESEDAALEAWLRQPTAPLADDGFSQRVLAALPPRTSTSLVMPPRRDINWARLMACMVGAGSGALVALLARYPLSLSPDVLEAFFAKLGDPSTLAVLLVAAASALYALRPRALRQLLP
jgi:hypothetical protein